jgi:hypothetical protein
MSECFSLDHLTLNDPTRRGALAKSKTMTEVNKRYPLPTPTHTHKPKNEKRRRRKNICNEVSKELEEKTYIILQCFDETIKRAFVSRISHHS